MPAGFSVKSENRGLCPLLVSQNSMINLAESYLLATNRPQIFLQTGQIFLHLGFEQVSRQGRVFSEPALRLAVEDLVIP